MIRILMSFRELQAMAFNGAIYAVRKYQNQLRNPPDRWSDSPSYLVTIFISAKR